MYTCAIIMRATAKHLNTGFTLIELLLVVSLIGIMVGFIITVINPTLYMKRARDSRRISDVTALARAVSFALSGGYIKLQDTTFGCSNCTSITGTKDTDGVNGWVKFTTTSSGGLSEFMGDLPEDPINDATYYFEFASDGSKFELNTQLEDPQHYIKITNEGGNDMTRYEVGTSFVLIP